MAKKLFYNRVKASMCPVYEDISEDEFDPTEIQIVEKPYSYLGSIFRASTHYLGGQRDLSITDGNVGHDVFANMIETAYKETENIVNSDGAKSDLAEGDVNDVVKVKEEPLDASSQDELPYKPIADVSVSIKKELDMNTEEQMSEHFGKISENDEHLGIILETGKISENCRISENADRFGKISEISEQFGKISENAEQVGEELEDGEISENRDISENGAISENADNEVVSKPCDEKLLMEWSDISDDEEHEHKNDDATKHSEIPNQVFKEKKATFRIKVSDNLFPKRAEIGSEQSKYSTKIQTENKVINSSPPSIPYFFIEQKELLAKPWKIETTPTKISLSRKSAANESNVEHFDCPHCTRKYWKQSKLREHIKIQHFEKIKKVDNMDTADKRIEISRCPECKEQLKTKTDMYVHRLTHLVPDFKTMKCPLCGDSQHTFPNLKQHVKTQHNLQEKWFCPVCPDARTFTQNHSLLIHISTFHFDSAKEAPSQYPCMQCKKPFGSKALLGRHINSTHLRPYLAKHLDNKIFKCYVCGRGHGKFSHLKKHLKTRHMYDPSLQAMDKGEVKVDFASRLIMLKSSLHSWSNKLNNKLGTEVSSHATPKL